MLNAEKLLGGLIRGSVRGRRGGLGSLLTSGVAMGALGVAMEAVDHYMSKPKAGATPPPPPTPGRTGLAPPPMPPAGPPSAAPTASPATAVASPVDKSEAVLLIRAMIAAANADGVIDQNERNQIMQRLRAIDLSAEEHAFIIQELLSPADLESIVAGVDSAALARQVYTVSLMAIDVDTPQEVEYMATLASRLGLDPDTIDEIKRGLDLE
jgi:uncharacterized membrane protein YebE (DUF533 family)